MASFDPIRAFDGMDPQGMINKLHDLMIHDKRKTVGITFSTDPSNPSLKTRVRFVGKTESGDPVLTAIKGFMLLGKPEEAMALMQQEIQKGQVIFEGIVIEEGKEKVYAITSPEISEKFKTGKYKLIGMKDGSLHQYSGITTIGSQKFAEIAKLASEKLKLKTAEKANPQTSAPKAPPIAPVQVAPVQVAPPPQAAVTANPVANPAIDPDLDVDTGVPSAPQPPKGTFEPVTNISVNAPVAPPKNPAVGIAPEEKPKPADPNGAQAAAPAPAVTLPPNQPQPAKIAPEQKPSSAILEALDAAEVKATQMAPKPQPEIKK